MTTIRKKMEEYARILKKYGPESRIARMYREKQYMDREFQLIAEYMGRIERRVRKVDEENEKRILEQLF